MTGDCGYVRDSLPDLSTLLTHAYVVSRNAQGIRGQVELCCQDTQLEGSKRQLEVVCRKAMWKECSLTIL